MARRLSWAGLTPWHVANRLGRRLGVGFTSAPPVGFGGQPDGGAELAPDVWVMLEVEHSQTHPEGNVLKYWPWLERNQRRVILVHAIAPDARKRRGPRTDLTIWLGRKIETGLRGRFRYCRIELGTEREEEQVARAKATIAGSGVQP